MCNYFGNIYVMAAHALSLYLMISSCPSPKIHTVALPFLLNMTMTATAVHAIKTGFSAETQG